MTPVVPFQHPVANPGRRKPVVGQFNLMAVAIAVATLATTAPGGLVKITVSVQNVAPADGAVITPVWFGIHNGDWDTFSLGGTAPHYLERLAEDGFTDFIRTAFGQSGAGKVQSILPGIGIPGQEGLRDLAPGDRSSLTVSIDPLDPTSRWFSFAHMVVPSNDAFSANDDPRQYPLFDASGKFHPINFTTDGNTMVFDAGTELNDEVPKNTALLGQTVPDTGVVENDPIALHPGFKGSARLGGPKGNILRDPRFANADFTRPGGYPLTHVSVTLASDAGRGTGSEGGTGITGGSAAPLPPAAWASIPGFVIAWVAMVRRRAAAVWPRA